MQYKSLCAACLLQQKRFALYRASFLTSCNFSSTYLCVLALGDICSGGLSLWQAQLHGKSFKVFYLCGMQLSNSAGVALPQVNGLPTNQAFLKRLTVHPAFQAAELDTSFIQKHHASLTETAAPPFLPLASAPAWGSALLIIPPVQLPSCSTCPACCGWQLSSNKCIKQYRVQTLLSVHMNQHM